MKRISHVVKGSRPITGELALPFGRAFGQSPEHWMNLQHQYDLARAERALGKWSVWFRAGGCAGVRNRT